MKIQLAFLLLNTFIYQVFCLNPELSDTIEDKPVESQIDSDLSKLQEDLDKIFEQLNSLDNTKEISKKSEPDEDKIEESTVTRTPVRVDLNKAFFSKMDINNSKKAISTEDQNIVTENILSGEELSEGKCKIAEEILSQGSINQASVQVTEEKEPLASENQIIKKDSPKTGMIEYCLTKCSKKFRSLQKIFKPTEKENIYSDGKARKEQNKNKETPLQKIKKRFSIKKGFYDFCSKSSCESNQKNSKSTTSCHYDTYSPFSYTDMISDEDYVSSNDHIKYSPKPSTSTGFTTDSPKSNGPTFYRPDLQGWSTPKSQVFHSSDSTDDE